MMKEQWKRMDGNKNAEQKGHQKCEYKSEVKRNFRKNVRRVKIEIEMPEKPTVINPVKPIRAACWVHGELFLIQ
jgi:hypothetical protein